MRQVYGKIKLQEMKWHETCKSSSTDDDLLNFTPQCFLKSAVQIVPNASERTDACKSKREYNILFKSNEIIGSKMTS